MAITAQKVSASSVPWVRMVTVWVYLQQLAAGCVRRATIALRGLPLINKCLVLVDTMVN